MEKHILNSNGTMTVNNVIGKDGKPIVLPAQAVAMNRVLQEQCNALGYRVDITTLTAISARVAQQKFYTIDITKYLPVKAAAITNVWADQILKFREYAVGGDFASGIINQGEGLTRLAETDVRLDSFLNKAYTWAKQLTWALPELMQAQMTQNWDLVEAKERSRLKNYQLGIQTIAFVGDPNFGLRGLLNMAGVNSNTSIITKPIKNMTDAEFQAFVAAIIQAYRANSNYTAMPDRFIIPESDYTGMVTPTNTNFAIRSKLNYLLEAFKEATGNPNFQILPSVYGSSANNAGYTGLGLNRYVLTSYDEDGYSMDVPVPYTTTSANSTNGFQFQNVGYSRFTGAVAGRPLETLYFDY